jgi:hypothetical protein
MHHEACAGSGSASEQAPKHNGFRAGRLHERNVRYIRGRGNYFETSRSLVHFGRSEYRRRKPTMALCDPNRAKSLAGQRRDDPLPPFPKASDANEGLPGEQSNHDINSKTTDQPP